MKNKKRLLALVVCFSLVFSLVAYADDARVVKVTAYDVNIRAGGSTEQPVIAEAQFGDTFPVVAVQNGWYEVKLSGGQNGWISASLVTEGNYFANGNPTIQMAESTAANVNVRDGASTSFDVITTISPGTTYPLLQNSGDWIQIRLPDERTGWVNKNLVKLSESTAKSAAQAEQQEATVIADTLNVRSDKAADAPILGSLKQGDIAQVVGKGDDWTQIRFQNTTGYVKSDYIRLQSDPAKQAQQPAEASDSGPSITLTTSTNIRSGPGTNFTLLQTGAAGSTFPIRGKSGQWWEIALTGGKTGWVAGWLGQVNGQTDKVPEQKQSLDNSLHGKTIVLDPGHGGFDVGAIGVTGLYEKDATLALTRILYNKLVTTGANVVMTRSDDSFVSLEDRVKISEQDKADLFVSLHYNTNPNPNLSGSITYYYNENGADHQLATLVEQDLVHSLGLPDLGSRFGDYYVLRENPQTAILIETSFLSNTGDEKMAKDPNLEEKAAEGIFQALVNYLQSH